MAPKVNILRGITDSYAYSWKNKGYLFCLFWLPLLCVISLKLLMTFVGAAFLTEHNLPFKPFAAGYLFAMYTLFASTFIALHKKILLQEDPLKYFEPQRGIEERKSAFKIPFYFRIGKQELLLGFLISAIIFTLSLIPDLVGKIFPVSINDMMMNNEQFQKHIMYRNIAYFGSKILLILFIVQLVYLGSHIALNKSLALKNILMIMKATCGNFLRLTLIILACFIPLAATSISLQVITYFFYQAEILSQKISWIMALNVGYYSLSYLFQLYSCLLVTILSSLLYKHFVPSHRNEETTL